MRMALLGVGLMAALITAYASAAQSGYLVLVGQGSPGTGPGGSGGAYQQAVPGPGTGELSARPGAMSRGPTAGAWASR